MVSLVENSGELGECGGLGWKREEYLRRTETVKKSL